ncbi:hypothetical protein [Streptomyces sp. YS-3]|uniref:hypothetical protein n=1 Tax=Streptomyces sp. YS-3 TaxID=3381352 RepID=UPI0038626BEC
MIRNNGPDEQILVLVRLLLVLVLVMIFVGFAWVTWQNPALVEPLSVATGGTTLVLGVMAFALALPRR